MAKQFKKRRLRSKFYKQTQHKLVEINGRELRVIPEELVEFHQKLYDFVILEQYDARDLLKDYVEALEKTFRPTLIDYKIKKT